MYDTLPIRTAEIGFHATHTVCGRYPLKVNGVWRSTCSKHPAHWWQPVSAPAEREATR